MDKIIYQPLRPMILTQGFGENKVCVDLETSREVIGCDGENPPAGFQSLYGDLGHTGIDLATWRGQEVYCVQNGVVDEIDSDSRTGLDVRVVSIIDGARYRHIYEHLMGFQCTVGAKVKTGQLIGWADNTGWSSGDHLHFQFEIWDGTGWMPIDPLPRMAAMFAKNMLAVNSLLAYIKEQVALIVDRLADWIRRRA